MRVAPILAARKRRCSKHTMTPCSECEATALCLECMTLCSISLFTCNWGACTTCTYDTAAVGVNWRPASAHSATSMRAVVDEPARRPAGPNACIDHEAASTPASQTLCHG